MILLGARGRLGTIFAKQYSNLFEIIEVGSKPRRPQGGREYYSSTSELRGVFQRRKPELIVNLAAVWGPKSTQELTWQAGYEFPKKVLELIKREQETVKWIQFDSYYNLYFELHGLDKDFYSKTKRIFFDFLAEQRNRVDPVQVIAPHLVGRSEPPGRFFRVVTEGILNRQSYSLGSGEQYLPFLHLDDAADQLRFISQSPNLGSIGRINLRPSGQRKLKSIVSHAHLQFGVSDHIAEFGEALASKREFYTPLILNNSDWLPEPRHTLKSILSEQWHERQQEKGSAN